MTDVDSLGRRVAGAPAVEAPRDATNVGTATPIRQAVFVAISAGLGYGFDSYAVNIFGMLSPVFSKELGISVEQIGTIGSIFLVGYALGTFGFGALADSIGRRNALRFSIVLYGLTTALGGVVSSVSAITWLRFLTGVGGAGELAVGAPYTAEMWPAKHRGLGTGGIMFALFALGYIVAAAAALIIVPVYGWRWAFIFAAVPAALVFLVRCFVPDSSRFKETQDRETSRGKGTQGETERDAGAQETRHGRQNIFRIPGAPKRLFLGWLLYVANACGYWGITYFLTTFMVQKFHLSATDAIFYAMLFYVAQFVLSFAGTMLSDRIGRRPAGILGAVLMIVSTVLASTAATLLPFLIYGAAMIGLLGWLWGIGDTYLSEFFRTSLRGTGFGIMVGGGRVVSIFAPFLVGWGITEFGPTAPFLATASLWLLTIVAYLLGPETARRELEEVQL